MFFIQRIASSHMDTKEKIVNDILKKKSISGISEEVVKSELDSYLKKEKISIVSLTKKDISLIVHDLRSILRKLSGRFRKESDEDFHISTDERLEFYKEVKYEISKINPKRILDLGCGINPLFLAEKKVTYNAYDIDETSIDKVKSYFNENGITGEVKSLDIRKKYLFPKSDLCLMLKVLDLVDKEGHKTAEMIIRNTDSKNYIISFSTKTLSGKPMNHPQRGWIEHLLSRLGYSFTTLKTTNEIYYIAKKLS